MAEKRMFSKQIIDSDVFLDMPLSTQALYFHLSMRADDDGFLNNAKKILRLVGANQNDYDLLVAKAFIIQFPDGICVIKHWRINNYLRKDRYVETIYQEEKSMIEVNKNGSYSLKKYNGIPDGIPDGNHSDTQIRIDKNREEENSIYSASEMHSDEESLDEFFESIWKLYPIKKGKGSVSKTKKQKLYRIGYDQMKRCVERFVEDMKSENRDVKYWMHGSTFFNSGYVDYLDENWCEEIPEENTPVNTDRFSCLEHDFRKHLEEKGVIQGQSLNLGNATETEIQHLRKAGVL